MNDIIRDNGYKSRKLWFSVSAMVILLVGWIATAAHPALVTTYGTFAGYIVAIVTVFLTGNVANKWVGTQAPQDPVVVTPRSEVIPGTYRAAIPAGGEGEA